MGSNVGGVPVTNPNVANSSGSAQSQAATAPVGQSQGPSTGGNVQADPSTNSLVITAPEPLYRQMRAVIDQLDTRRAQVYVEAIIVKVDANKSGQFGVQWQSVFGRDGKVAGLAGTNSNVTGGNILSLIAGAASGGTEGAAAIAGSIAGGFNLGLARKVGEVYSLAAIANFLETQTGGNILSAPNLVALDNEEAKIVVGQNVPFVTGTFTNTGSTGSVNPFNTVERKDVGLVLRVRSQIGEGGAIRMSVTTENSAIAQGSTAGNLITDKSEIQTSVAVDDGGILVLGGLMRDEFSDADDGVPGLSKIPLLGHLFKSAKRERKKTNLMVFLRPTVLRNADATAQFMLDRYEQIRAVQQSAQPRESAVLPDTGAPVLPAPPAARASGTQ
jgi:general secretion pathway protein D